MREWYTNKFPVWRGIVYPMFKVGNQNISTEIFFGLNRDEHGKGLKSEIN